MVRAGVESEKCELTSFRLARPISLAILLVSVSILDRYTLVSLGAPQKSPCLAIPLMNRDETIGGLCRRSSLLVVEFKVAA